MQRSSRDRLVGEPAVVACHCPSLLTNLRIVSQYFNRRSASRSRHEIRERFGLLCVGDLDLTVAKQLAARPIPRKERNRATVRFDRCHKDQMEET